MTKHLATVAALVVATFAAATTGAQAQAAANLPPEVLGLLQEMHQVAALNCHAGTQEACDMMVSIENHAHSLGEAHRWCANNNEHACEFYRIGAEQVVTAHQQYLAAMVTSGFPFTSEEHQRIVDGSREALESYQRRYVTQKEANDAAHGHFIESLRE